MPASREQTLRIRVTDEERALLTAAAEAAGMTLSGWLRHIAVKEAKANLRREQKERRDA